MPITKPTWLNSLSLKVLLAYVIGSLLSIALIVLLVFATVISRGDVLSGSDVAALTKDMARMLEFDRAGNPIGFDRNADELASWLYESLKQETAYRVLDAAGNVVLSSAAGPAFWPQTGAVRNLKRGRFQFTHDGVAMRGATQPIQHNGRTWFLQNAVSTRFFTLAYRAFALPFAVVGITVFGLVLLFVFGACAYVTLRYTLKPLREISESAAAISPRSLHVRLRTKSVPTEIAPLVESFNRVLERLEHGYRIQQGFLATAAHELKTPLALLRTQIELRDSPDRTALLRDVEHMTRQVQQLLHLAEASEIKSYRFTAVDVHEVVTEAAGYLQRMADASEVSLVTPVRAVEVKWLADRGAFFTLLKNLLENAIEHAPRGTEVRVDVTAIEVSVRDWGPGVHQEHLTQMFSRFWRGAHRRDDGAGLGLAICQEIALAHGWTLSAQRAEPGLRLHLSGSTTEESLKHVARRRT